MSKEFPTNLEVERSTLEMRIQLMKLKAGTIKKPTPPPRTKATDGMAELISLMRLKVFEGRKRSPSQ